MQLTSKSGRVITLRPPQAGDEQILFDYAKALEAENTYVLLNPDFPVTYQEEVDYLRSILRRLEAHWQVMYLAFAGEVLIGSCQINVQGRRKMHVGSFGISLLKEYRRDGLGEQLAKLVIGEAIKQLHVTLITLEVFEGNLAADNLYRKLGFVDYGRLPQGLHYQGHFQDALYLYLKV